VLIILIQDYVGQDAKILGAEVVYQ